MLDHSFKDIEQSDRIIVAQESVVIKVFVESIVESELFQSKQCTYLGCDELTCDAISKPP